MLDLAGVFFISLLTGSLLGASTVSELARPAGIELLASAMDVDVVSAGLQQREAHLVEAADAALAEETLAVFAPLADRLGLSAERARLEDESFRLLNPMAHAALGSDLGPAPDLAALVDDTQRALAAEGIQAVVTGRTKSLYSVHQKMMRKDVPASEISDRTGLRIQVGTTAECYRVRDLLEARHRAVPGTRDDYIADPKPSGYRSLHTAVQAHDAVVEFQVRTFAMHREAEEGDAAHWRYKLAS